MATIKLLWLHSVIYFIFSQCGFIFNCFQPTGYSTAHVACFNANMATSTLTIDSNQNLLMQIKLIYLRWWRLDGRTRWQLSWEHGCDGTKENLRGCSTSYLNAIWTSIAFNKWLYSFNVQMHCALGSWRTKIWMPWWKSTTWRLRSMAKMSPWNTELSERSKWIANVKD